MPELQFRGKEFVYNHHLTVPYRPLEMDARKSIGKPNLNGNLIIHSDNLHALKALLPLYAGKVDCIFIDPPYNTGNENWSYNDNVNSPMMREWLSSNPVTIEDGLRHDKWCAMMYPRLKLLHELLSEDGIFWMTLDDNEVHHARTILDEIFGEPHFVAQLVWKSRKAEDTRALSGISTDHEYVLCYAKNGAFRASGVAIDKAKFTNPDNDDRGPWRSADMTGLANAEQRPNLHYVVTDPKTGTEYPTPERGWRYEKSEMLRRIGENRILWPAEPQGRPRQKLFLRELQRTTKNFSSVITFISTGDGSKEIDLIFGSRVFDFPKPSALVQFLIEQSTTPDAVILDSFAGSATTGHAVLAANLKDAGNRRFILVESEDYADSLTAERMRRVIRGKREAQATLLKDGLGGEFTFCTLGDPLDLDKILTGKTLPDYEAIGAWLFHTATGESLNTSKVRKSVWFLGESTAYHVWLVYKPDLDFLKSNKAALTLELAQKIALDPDHTGKRHLVFAPAKYAPNKTLLPLGVEYAPLPFALYRVEKD